MVVQNAIMETDDDTSIQFRTLPGWLPGDPRNFCGIRRLGVLGPVVILTQYFGAVDAVVRMVRVACGVILQAKLTRHELDRCVRLALAFEAFADDKFIAVAVDGVH